MSKLPRASRDVAEERREWTPERILYEDEWLIVVDKPAGLPTQPTPDPGRASVLGLLDDFLRRRDGGTPYLGLHHRLDRDTSGVLLLTRSREANAGVAALFAGRAARKTYQALAVAGTACPDEWEVADHLGVVGRSGKVVRYGAVRSGGDPAQTSFRLLERLPGVLWIEARPRTGRTHQIRVHLAGCGHPIFGDTLYGGPAQVACGARSLPVPRVMLHAAALEFTHPVTSAALSVRSPLPPDFAACLSQNRAVGE
jgi:RluA family pseudouridine synthase